MTAAREIVRRFAAADVEGWQGLPAGLALAELEAFLPVAGGATGSGFLGEERRPARWMFAASELYRGGLRVWHDESGVLVLEGRDPFDDTGSPLSAPDLGEPEAVLDTALGRLLLAGGEQVYATRGLVLRVNPENGLLLGVLGLARATVEDYLARLRPDMQPMRLLPDPASQGSTW